MAIISEAELNFGKVVGNLIISAVNRETRLIKTIRSTKGVNAGGPTWNVEGGGITTVSHADGSTFSTPSKDATAQASLGWANYETPIQLTDAVISLAANTNNPDYGGDEAARQIAKAISNHLKKIEIDAFAGTGASNTLVGLAVAIDDASTYAGLSHTLPYWQSVVKAGSGGTRTITRPLLRDFFYAMAQQSGQDPAGLTAYCSWGVFNQLVGLFDQVTQFQAPATTAQAFNIGTSQVTNPRVEGVSIMPVFDGYNSAGNGNLLCLPPSVASFQVMPYKNDPTKVIADGLPLGMQVLVDPTGGHSSRYIIRNKLQLVVNDPFVCGKMTNIATF